MRCLLRFIQRSLSQTVPILLGSGVWAQAATQSFSNSAALSTPATHAGAAGASLYPSPIRVSGMSGNISKVTVRLNGIHWDRPDDMEVHLVGPTGARIHLLSDAGGTSLAANGINLVFDDAAASLIPDLGPLTSGSFRPTSVNITRTSLPAPAPGGDYRHAAPFGTATLGSEFNGTNPNGTWSLYVADDVSSGNSGGLSNGWSLDITTSDSIAPTLTTIQSSQSPSETGQFVTFTAQVLKSSDNSPVTEGTVSFLEGATVISGPGPISNDGHASLSIGALSEGTHTITARFNGTSDFNGSQGSTVQSISNPTSVTGIKFCNTGSLVVASSAPGLAHVYPSLVHVSGLSGNISKLRLTLSGLNIDRPDDLELLLVGPDGTAFVVLGDAGGTSSAGVNLNLIFDDAASSLVPDSVPLVSGTFRPTSFHSSSTAFPAPAPSTGIQHPAPFGVSSFATLFNGKNPNGTWALYILDDVGGGGATLTQGWCLSIQTGLDPATSTQLLSSKSPALTGEAVTFTASVKESGSDTPVSAGSITFLQDSTILATGVALDGEGHATLTTSSIPEGSHTVTAVYSGVAGVAQGSNAVRPQQIDNATEVSDNRYSNPGPLTVSSTAPAVATSYPSHLTVSGLSGLISHIELHLNGLSIDRPDDLEILLVGPTGANLVVLSDAGGTAAANGLNVILTDKAGSTVPDAGPLASGSFRPTSVNSTPHNFPLPAPPAPWSESAPTGSATFLDVFGGTNPNGTWSLYVLDDVAGGGATLAHGWSLTLETVIPPNLPPNPGPDTLTRTAGRPAKILIRALLANDHDTDGPNPLELTSVASPSANGATVRIAGDYVVYDGDAGNAADSFTYTVSDGNASSNGTVSVSVTTATSALLTLVSTTVFAGERHIVTAGIIGRTYRLQVASDLAGPWTDVPGAGAVGTIGTSGTVLLKDLSPASGILFYRTVQQ